MMDDTTPLASLFADGYDPQRTLGSLTEGGAPRSELE